MRLKIAVIGAGSMGMNHLRVLRGFDEERVQLVGIADTAAMRTWMVDSLD